MKKQYLINLDTLGISSSTLCLIHCLAFPILTFLPLELSHNHWIDLLFASIGMFVVSKIIMSDTTRLVKTILSISIVIIITGVVIELLCDITTPMVLIGGVGMIIGHLLNFKTHKHN